MSAASLVSKSVTLMQHMLGKSALHLLFYLNRNFGSSCFQMQLCQCWTHFFFFNPTSCVPKPAYDSEWQNSHGHWGAEEKPWAVTAPFIPSYRNRTVLSPCMKPSGFRGFASSWATTFTCHSAQASRYCFKFMLTLLKLVTLNILHSREGLRKIVQNFNALNFTTFHSVNCLYGCFVF